MKKKNLRSILHGVVHPHKDLQPWLDYFGLLATYIRQGLLELAPSMTEAYITRPALHTLADPHELATALLGKNNRMDKRIGSHLLWRGICTTVIHLRTYAQYLAAAQSGYASYLAEREQAEDKVMTDHTTRQAVDNIWRADVVIRRGTFAIHVVKDTQPHDLLYTILLSYRRRWWSLWKKSPHYEIINYRQP